MRKAFGSGPKQTDGHDAGSNVRPAGKGGRKRAQQGNPEVTGAAAAGPATVAGAGGSVHRQAGEETAWAPGVLHDGGDGVAAVAAPAEGGDFGGPAQCGGAVASEASAGGAGLDENRAQGEELTTFEPTVVTATAIPVGEGGGGGLGDMLCDGGGLGVDGDSVGGLGEDSGGLDDGLGGL